jgi:hypothetical protein
MIDLADALWNQRHETAAAKNRLVTFRDVVGWPGDLLLGNWVQLYALSLEFAPDLIVELGRGYGNSTCVFIAAANRLQNTKVVSIGHDSERTWASITAARLKKVVPPNWFNPIETLEQDILDTDFAKIFSPAKSIFLFWDAHGKELADYVLAEIFPHLQDKKHVILVHDISDARHDDLEPSYVRADGLPQNWLGYLVGPFAELVPLYDFFSRNGIAYDTAIASLKRGFLREDTRRAELEKSYGIDFPKPTPLEASGVVYFDLNNRHPEYHARRVVFPKFERSSEGNAPLIETKRPGTFSWHLRQSMRNVIAQRFWRILRDL